MFSLATPDRQLRHRLARAILCSLLGLRAVTAWAAPTVEFDFDDPPDTGQVISDAAKWGMDLHANIEARHDLDLDHRLNDRLSFIEPEIRIALSYIPPGKPWQGFLEMEVAGKSVLDDPAGNESPYIDLRLRQGYLLLPDLGHGFSLQVGRQSFKDARTWWYDEKMDALRLFWRHERFGLELAAARERLLPEDLFDAETREKNDYKILAGHYALTRKSTLHLLGLRRDDREGRKNEDPHLLGVQIEGEVGKDFRYWLNAARLSGEARGRQLRASGWDTGAAWRFNLPWRPYVALGAAWGGGDRNGRDSIDRNFRQSDIQENKARLFGLTRYNYYGEAFDPELSNMRIMTAVVGFQPQSDISFDLVYHDYSQHVADDDLFDSDLDMDPDGDHRDLGRELDLVAGMRLGKDTRLKFVIGAFFPGNAFPGADTAYVSKIEVGWKF